MYANKQLKSMDMNLFMASYAICPGNKRISQLFLLITIVCRTVELCRRSLARALIQLRGA